MTPLGLTAPDLHAIGQSVWMTAAGVLVSVLPAVAVAWVLARRDVPGKVVLETLVNLPLVLPPVMTGYLLLRLFGRRGAAGPWVEYMFGVEIALSWRAIPIAAAVMGFPLLVRTVRLALERVDPRLVLAARTLGAGPFDAFFTVTLPLAADGIIAGMALAFARGLGEFGATMIFAGNMAETRTLALQFYNTLEGPPGASADARLMNLMLASLLLGGVSLGLSEYFQRRGDRRRSREGRRVPG